MARQGLHQHRKFLRLSRTLKSAPLARGVLEMLWEPAYDSGDDFLGDGEDIAARCGWTGPSAELLTALVESEFIDEDQERPGHFVIHDLFDHAPDAVAKRAQREAERITRGQTLSEMRAEAGRKGMERRWGRNKRITTDNKRITNLATPSPTPTPSPPLEAGEKPNGARAPGPASLQELWNTTAHSALPRWEEMPNGRVKKALARLKERPLQGPASWEEVINRISESAFCRGETTDRGWKANPDWLLKPDTAAKVLEGQYEDGQTRLREAQRYDPNGGIMMQPEWQEALGRRR